MREPCSACGQKPWGRSVLAYPASLNGGARAGARVRLCPKDARTYMANLADHFQQYDHQDGRWAGVKEVCHFCGNADLPDGTHWLFVTVYPSRDKRQDYAGLACPDCAGRAAKEMLLDAS